MELLKTELHNLACLEKMATKDDIIDLVLGSEQQIFVEGLYKNGPTMISISLSEFRKKDPQPIKVYIPVNIKIEETDSFKYIEHLTMEKSVMKRLSLQDNLDQAISDMKDYACKNGYGISQDILYMTFYPVFDEYWVDLQLLIEEV